MRSRTRNIKLVIDYFANIRARNVIRRRLVREQVPGRLERLINKAERIIRVTSLALNGRMLCLPLSPASRNSISR